MIRFVREALCWSLLLAAFAAAGLTITGAGATFPWPVYAKWAAQYRQATGVEISYAPVGSGGGIDRIERRLVDFGASDTPLSPAELQRMGLLQFPAVIGGLVPVLNISGIQSEDLKLTGEVLGDIYLGKIRKWNDPAIALLNPGLDLPKTNITVVHRSDASGTTQLWSEYLSRSNAEWQARVGAAQVLNWPVGVANAGNEGVAATVQRTRMSIGYVEYAYAKQHRLKLASLRNHAGLFVKPGRAAFEAAAKAASSDSSADLRQWLIDEPGTSSWPIVGASFILLPADPTDPARTFEVLKFFDWALRNGKQTAADLDYVPMPDATIRLIEKAWPRQGSGVP